MVFIYDNKIKDKDGVWLKILIDCLNKKGIEYKVLSDDDLSNDAVADVIFVLGGDGTVLYVGDFANRNSIPIIGINAGKLGFLSEFDACDIQTAVDAFISGSLKKEEKLSMEIDYNGKRCFAINDAYLQRMYTSSAGCIIVDVSVKVDGLQVCKVKGDGVILSTPTGSTAYSLSAGGSIMVPGVGAISITPLAAHSLNQRPIVCSSNSLFELTVCGNSTADLFVDGNFIGNLTKGDSFTMKKAEKPTIFLRKDDYNFINRLYNKFNDNGEKYG